MRLFDVVTRHECRVTRSTNKSHSTLLAFGKLRVADFDIIAGFYFEKFMTINSVRTRFPLFSVKSVKYMASFEQPHI